MNYFTQGVCSAGLARWRGGMESETREKSSWLPLALGLGSVVALGLWGVYAGPHSAAMLRQSVERAGAEALAVGGNSFARVEVRDGVAVVLGAAPDAAAREAAFAAVSAALARAQGLPGVIATIEDRMVIDADKDPPARAAAPEASPVASIAPEEASPGPDAADCEEAFQRTIEGRSISFTSGGAAIAAESHPLLDELAAVALRCAAYVITVEGHTDPRGDAASNKALSQRRAQAVVDYLVSKGAPADALSAQGFGEERLLDESGTPEGLARNRRTEFKVAARPS